MIVGKALLAAFGGAIGSQAPPQQWNLRRLLYQVTPSTR